MIQERDYTYTYIYYVDQAQLQVKAARMHRH